MIVSALAQLAELFGMQRPDDLRSSHSIENSGVYVRGLDDDKMDLNGPALQFDEIHPRWKSEVK